jgi:hypothetical protein
MNRAPTPDSSSPHGAHRWRGPDGLDGRTWVRESACITQGLNDKNTSGAMNRAPTRDSSSPHGAHRWRGQNGRDGRTWVGESTCITQGLNDKNTSGAMNLCLGSALWIGVRYVSPRPQGAVVSPWLFQHLVYFRESFSQGIGFDTISCK